MDWPLIGWALVGIATGIKLTGIFVVMPQYLISTTGSLPKWFGAMIILNSVLVVLAQHHVMAKLDKAGENATLWTSLTAMILLAVPSLFWIQNLGCATLWITLLTLGECALSRYDSIARKDGYLFIKELMVGIGSLITVLISRNFSGHIYLSGLIGALCILIGIAATRKSKS